MRLIDDYLFLKIVESDYKIVQTETLTISAKPLVKGYVKAKTGDSTPQSVYDNWFKSVYLPASAAAATPAQQNK